MLSARVQLGLCIPRQHRLEVLEASGVRELCVEPRQIRVWLDAVRLRGFDQRVQIGTGLCTGLRVAEQPVLSPDDKWPNGVFASIVVERYLGSIQEHDQLRPLSQCIGNRFTEGALRQHLGAHRDKPAMQFGHDRRALRVTDLQSLFIAERGGALAQRLFDTVEPADVIQGMRARVSGCA